MAMVRLRLFVLRCSTQIVFRRSTQIVFRSRPWHRACISRMFDYMTAGPWARDRVRDVRQRFGVAPRQGCAPLGCCSAALLLCCSDRDGADAHVPQRAWS